MSKKNQTISYESPCIEVVAVQVELGIAASVTSENTGKYPGEDTGW